MLYAGILTEYPRHPRIWMSYGHALKTAGHQERAIEAYRRSLELEPGFGEVWWSLANLKTFRFPAEDLATMRRELQTPDLAAEDRQHLEFAHRQGAGGRGRIRGLVRPLPAGQRAAPREPGHTALTTPRRGWRASATATPANSSNGAQGAGCDAPDPIFIVGLPRAGSTLLEQILSSHSAVEGTMELPEITSMTRALRKPGRRRPVHALPRRARVDGCRRPARAGRTLPAPYPHPAQDGRAVLHRQDAEQLPAYRADPADAAQRQDHRRAPAPAGVLLLRLQAALRARAELHLRASTTSAATTATTSS